MNYSPETRKILEELERRKAVKEDPCDSCDGTGKYEDRVCPDCLGQGVLLTREEYNTILLVSGIDDDSILDATEIG
jgi:DnaJ-class molecular chaperone